MLDGSSHIPVTRLDGAVPGAWELAEDDPSSFRYGTPLPGEQQRRLPPVEPRAVLGAEDNFASQPRPRKTGLAAIRPAALEPFRRPDPCEDVWLIPRHPASVATSDRPIPLPPGDTRLDAGVALAAITGSDGTVAGYCVAIDVVRRDVPVEHAYLARSHRGHTVLGPILCTPDELPDPALVELSLHVDDELRQQSLLSDMIVQPSTLLESIRRRSTLSPGDVVLLGTPPGTADDRGSGWLTDGTIVRAAIGGIGEIEAVVAREPA